jgi:hypothetical protein
MFLKVLRACSVNSRRATPVTLGLAVLITACNLLAVPSNTPVAPDDSSAVPDETPEVPDDRPAVPNQTPEVPDDKPAVPYETPLAPDEMPVTRLDGVPSPVSILDIADNREDYLGEKIPKYEKLEISFQIQGTVAQNLQFPYDPSPPPGIDPADPAYQGITVNAVFTPDDWQTSFVQPAFYYQEFKEDQVNGREWYYPTGDFSWKVRFSPHVPGN